MTEPTSSIADLIELLDPDLRELFEERAGIREFDGGQTRDQAETAALIELLRVHPDALSRVCLVQVEAKGGTEYVLTTDIELVRKRRSSRGAHLSRVVIEARAIEQTAGKAACLGHVGLLLP